MVIFDSIQNDPLNFFLSQSSLTHVFVARGPCHNMLIFGARRSERWLCTCRVASLSNWRWFGPKLLLVAAKRDVVQFFFSSSCLGYYIINWLPISIPGHSGMWFRSVAISLVARKRMGPRSGLGSGGFVRGAAFVAAPVCCYDAQCAAKILFPCF